jgi:hypothetical protein
MTDDGFPCDPLGDHMARCTDRECQVCHAPTYRPMTTEEAREWFESVVASMQEPFIDARRREADELVASAAGQTTHVASIRRRRAGTLRSQATKWEKWVAEGRRVGEEDAARRSVVTPT